MLQRAREVIAVKTPQACPVCQKPADAAHLLKELDSRMATMKALADATKKTALQKRAFENASGQAVKADNDFLTTCVSTLADAKKSPLKAAKELLSPTDQCAVVDDEKKEIGCAAGCCLQSHADIGLGFKSAPSPRKQRYGTKNDQPANRAFQRSSDTSVIEKGKRNNNGSN